ncbi:MAG: gluconate 2-dehydrogenase subunit 3 family protein [Cytophagales bacterium]|tara:strand:- start:3361 stop:3933 length:573 start_codon:yes stop_codon:yes gene_type:complete
MMQRREAFKNISLFVSGSLIVPSTLLNSCSQPSKELKWEPKYLSKSEAFLLNELSNAIIPNTEYPGANAVGVPQEIEEYVFNVFSENEIASFRNDLNKFDDYLNNNPDKFYKSFYDTNLSEKTDILNSIQSGSDSEIRKIYLKIKSSVATSYFKSEVGATQVLKYNGPSIVLGQYKGCIPFSEVGKSWAI